MLAIIDRPLIEYSVELEATMAERVRRITKALVG